MAEVSVADFRNRFPEFTEADHPDVDVEFAIEEALLIHSVRKLATLYCVAHLLVVEGIGAGANGGGMGQIAIHGEVTELQVDSLRTRFTAQTATQINLGENRSNHETFFSRTEYGRHFLVLESRSPRAAIGAIVVG